MSQLSNLFGGDKAWNKFAKLGQEARHLGIPTRRVNEIVRGKRGVSAETAWLLSQAFGTTPQFWLNLQMNHDLALNRPKQPAAPLPIADL